MSSYSFQGRKRVWTPRDEEENRAIFSAMPMDTGIKMPHEFKPVYLENEEYVVEKWPVKQLIRLLRLYGSHRCLWDVRDPDNKNRQLRKAAMIDITAAMGKNVSTEQVLQKINVLRGTYRYEKRRIKQRIRNGMGASTKLRWFALADSFLRDVPRAERLKKPEDSDSDLDDTVVFAIDPEILIPLEEDNSGSQNQITEDKHYLKENTSVSPPSIESEDSHEIVNEEFIDVTNCPTEIKEETTSDSNVFLSKKTQKANKRPWTSKESLAFVELLRDYPSLRQNDPEDEEFIVENRPTLQHLADTMDFPLKSIVKRVRVLKKTYSEEKAKISLNPNYQSHLAWFTLAQSFMDSQLDYPNFVDPSLLPPETPINSENISIKEENDNSYEDQKLLETLVNPIPSVPPLSVKDSANDDADSFEYLLQGNTDSSKLSNIKSEILHTSEFETASNTPASHVDTTVDRLQESSEPPSTKLIWNGLEDDLLEGKWSLKHSVKFLRLYGSHRCLWDLNDPDYRSRELRHAAITDIAAAMGYGLDADYVAKKIKIFRITYMQHRKRMLEALKSGKQEPEIQLRWFPLADSFLRPHIGLRSIKDNEREMPQFDFQYVYANLNLIDPALLNDFVGKGTQNSIKIGSEDADVDVQALVMPGQAGGTDPDVAVKRQHESRDSDVHND